MRNVPQKYSSEDWSEVVIIHSNLETVSNFTSRAVKSAHTVSTTRMKNSDSVGNSVYTFKCDFFSNTKEATS